MRNESKSLIIIMVLFITTGSYTQNLKHKYAKQGTWETGGELFFSSSEDNYTQTGDLNSDRIDTYTNFTLSANAGCFVINGLKLGIEPAVEVNDIWGNTETRLKLFFTPEYVLDTKSKFYPFIAVSAGYQTYNQTYSNTGDGFTWGVKGGVKLNITGNSLLVIALRYYEESFNVSDNFYSTNQKSKQIGMSAGWSVFF
jgi:hypothetical protein